MKEYIFSKSSAIEKGIVCSLAATGSLALIYGITSSLAICYNLILIGGAVAYKYCVNDSYSFDKLIKNNLQNLIRCQGFYNEEKNKLTYRPRIQYSFDENFLTIKIRLDGSTHREKYLNLESHLEDLFVMQCISK
jgi:hypothetical protein